MTRLLFFSRIFLRVRCCLYGGMVLNAAKNYLGHGIIIMAFFASEKLFQFTNIIV